MFGGETAKKSMNTEIDLVAFISLLSVCICFLLLTTVWVQIASMNIKQAIGGQAEGTSRPKPEMWVVLESEGQMRFQLRNSPQKIFGVYGNNKIEGKEGHPDYEKLNNYLTKLTTDFDQLSIALIRPSKMTSFEDIIRLMDVFRKRGIEDLGITPI